MQPRAQDLRLLLLSLDQLNKLHVYSFEQLEDILLDDNYRKELDENTEYKRQYQTLYNHAITYFTKQIVQRSRHSFVAISREEFLNLKDDNENSHYGAMLENFNCLSTEVKISILKQNSIAKCVLTIERWVLIMQKCLGYYDYNSAVAIYASLNSTAIDKLKQHISLWASKLMEYMNELTSPKNQSENLRDVMVGRCIPLLSLYKGILIHAKEGSKGDYKPEEHDVVIHILNSLTNMQKEQRKFLSKNIPKFAKHKQLYVETLKFLDDLQHYKNQSAVNEIKKQITLAKTKVEEEKLIDEILYHVAKYRLEPEQDKQLTKLYNAQEVLKKINAKFPRRVNESQVNYELCINQIKEYSHVLAKNDSDDIKSQKVKLKEIIRELRNYSVLAQKIEYLSKIISGLENNFILPVHPATFTELHNVQLKLLRKLRDTLVEKEEHDSFQKHRLTRNQRDTIRRVFVEKFKIDLDKTKRINLRIFPNEPRHSSESSPRFKFRDKKNKGSQVSWHSRVVDNSPQESPRVQITQSNQRKQQRSSLTIDFNVLERARDSSHKISTAAIESSKEKLLQQKAFSKKHPPEAWDEFIRSTAQNPRNSVILRSAKPQMTHKPSNPTLFPAPQPIGRNKLRWSWPLVTVNDAQYPSEENPEIITIKVKARHYKK